MDFRSLRRDGIAELERLSGPSWTDFNPHDPGITILEQVIYALTDLGYRARFDVPDLLAGGSGDPYAALHPGPEVLTTRPVTPDDLRRLVVDIDGVRNAWVEPIPGGEPGIELHYHPGRNELGLEPDPPVTEPVHLSGLYRVVVERSSSDQSLDGLRGRVAAQLHANRPLCEDFADIRVLEEEPILVDASIEIESAAMAESVLVDLLEALTNEIAPPLAFVPFDEALRQGLTPEELFDGPLLRSGHLSDLALTASKRRSALHTSDLIRAVMDVASVQAVTRISVAAGGQPQSWSLTLRADRAPRLDAGRSTIELTKDGVATSVDLDGVIDEYRRRREGDAFIAPQEPIRERPTSAGRDRSVADYQSIQHHLPAIYGLGPNAPSESDSATRRAEAKQLRAYLLLLDQVLANAFAQLGGVGDVFSLDETGTYFAGVVDGEELGLDEVRGTGYDERLAEAVARTGNRANLGANLGADRNHRVLDHLLARYGEQLASHSFSNESNSDAAGAGRLADKRAFLAAYPMVSGGRGSGPDSLRPPTADNTSGLATRVSLLLGLDQQRGERLVLVEHLLLRPTTNDELQGLPILTEVAGPDPYSLQVSFVFAAVGRFEQDGPKLLAEQIVRDETPAHLTPYVHWLPGEEWDSFHVANDAWLHHRRNLLLTELGLNPTGFDEGSEQ